MHLGNIDQALQNISDLMALAKSNQFKDWDILTSEMYQQEGEAYAEIGRYDRAIESLSKAIAKDPENSRAYFERASAYFETGDFEKSLQDYLCFKKKAEHFQPYKLPPNEFVDAFSQAILKGSAEAAIDFVPSLCHTVFGLGKCLWAFGEHPIDSTAHFASTCYDMGAIAVEYLKTVDKEKLQKYADELVALYERFDQLIDKEKGELIGHIVGKYGTDIFAGAALAKAVTAFKNLREANRVCNLESMALSASNKEAVAAQALKQSAERTKFFNSSRIDWDKQNKHIPVKHNYEAGKSIFQHNDPERLLREYAGKGNVGKGKLGETGFKEIVDFNEHIGVWKNEIGDFAPTTKGKIHYKKNGAAHIVPAAPDTKIW